MLKKLFDLRVILAVILVVSWVIVGVFFWKYKKNTDTMLENKENEITRLETRISDLGELKDAYCVSANVVSGKLIDETDFHRIQVPSSMSKNLIDNSDDLIGKYFKSSMTEGTVITCDDIYEEVITDDMRYYDLIVDVLPIGLKPGAFVDVRIKFGTGADYVGIVHRKVAEINGNCLKLILTENDILTFSSMLVDNLVFSQKITATVDLNNDGKINASDSIDAIGSYIYAIEYVEGGLQTTTSSYYSPSVVVQAIMANDPNMLSSALTPEDMLLRRNLIKAGLLPDEQDEVSVVFTEKISNYVTKYITQGQSAYDKRIKDELKAAAKG